MTQVTFPKARKTHRCRLCSMPIPEGARYVLETTLDPKDKTYTHVACHTLIQRLDLYHGMDGSFFREKIREHVLDKALTHTDAEWMVMLQAAVDTEVMNTAEPYDIGVDPPLCTVQNTDMGSEECKQCPWNVDTQGRAVTCALNVGQDVA